MLTVREARPGDAAAMARVQLLGWRTAYVGLVPQESLDALDEDGRADRWRAILGGGEGFHHVCEDGSGGGASEGGRATVVGFVSARRFYEKRGWTTDGVRLAHEVRQVGMPKPVVLDSLCYTTSLVG